MLSITSINKKSWEDFKLLPTITKLTEELIPKLDDPTFNVDKDDVVKVFLSRANAYSYTDLPRKSRELYDKISNRSIILREEGYSLPSQKLQKRRNKRNQKWEEELEQRRKERIVPTPKIAYQGMSSLEMRQLLIEAMTLLPETQHHKFPNVAIKLKEILQSKNIDPNQPGLLGKFYTLFSGYTMGDIQSKNWQFKWN